MLKSTKLAFAIAAAAVVAATLAFTSPGRTILAKFGLAVACDSSCD